MLPAVSKPWNATVPEDAPVAVPVKLNVVEAQTEFELAEATTVGISATTKVFELVAVPQLPPEVVNVRVTVPV